MTREFERLLLRTGSGWAAISACSRGEVAYEDPDFQQGVFTYYLCEALTQPLPAAKTVTLEAAVDRVKTSMATWCDLKTKKQTPQFQTNISGVLDVSHVSPASPAPVVKEGTPDPIREFYQNLDQHLHSTPAGVRNFSFTDSAELDRITTQFFSISKEDWEKVDHPAIGVTIGDPRPLQNFPQAWQDFHAKIGQVKLNNEVVGKHTGMAINLKGTEVSVPDAALVIAAIRFKYFYWIWRTITFESAIKAEWKPKEPSIQVSMHLRLNAPTTPRFLNASRPIS
jgi:hypothetical protein